MKLYNGEVVSNHFKRKRQQDTKGNKYTRLVIVAMLLILAYFIVDIAKGREKEYDTEEILEQLEEQTVKVEQLRAEADITKAVLEARVSKADRFITEINNDIEYITLTEDGTNSIEHSRLSNDAGWWKKTFSESKVEVNFDYSAIFSIAISDIDIYSSEGIVYIDYDPNIIDVKSIEISNITTSSKKDWFGKKYTSQEVLAIIELAKEDIYEQLNSDENLKAKSCENLNTYLKQVAEKMKLDGFVINNEEVIKQSYQFIDNGTVAYNHPNQAVGEIKYIVLHSTACPDIEALDFYNRLNNSPTERGTSAHYYVDDKNVVEAIDNNLKAYHCGINNKIDCDNNNSLGVEVSEFTDADRQQRAIDNTVSFIKDILLVEFPNAKVIKHRDCRNTACPQILTDEQFTLLFGGE